LESEALVFLQKNAGVVPDKLKEKAFLAAVEDNIVRLEMLHLLRGVFVILVLLSNKINIPIYAISRHS
jgi:predicted nucleotide-binding protein